MGRLQIGFGPDLPRQQRHVTRNPVGADSEGLLPSQTERTNIPMCELEQEMALTILRDARRELLRLSAATHVRSLARVLNIMAWVDDPDGVRARKAGVPYFVVFRQVAELIPGVEAEAAADQLRKQYRTARQSPRLRRAA